MKKMKQLAVFALAVALCGLAAPSRSAAQTATDNDQQAQSDQAQPGADQSAATGPTIKDPAEYNSYTSALGMANPQMKAQALEQFLQQYPSTVVRKDALQQLLGAYQAANNLPKAADAATQLLQLDPSNVYALFILAYKNLTAMQGGNAGAAQEAMQYGEKGVQALASFAKPAGLAQDAYDKLKAQMSATFNTAAGMGALQSKDFPTAEKYLAASAESSPNDLSVIYPLATAYLSQKPLNPLGFWYGARAIDLSQNNAQARQQITNYVQKEYEFYHGGDDGWQQILQQAATATAPPAGFTVTQITPAIQAQKLASQFPDPKQMDFGTWEFIFQNGDPALADKVWTAIKGVPLAFKAKVISATKDQLTLAATDDAMTANTADTEVTMFAPIPLKLLPKVGDMIGVQAKPTSYDKQPYLLHMDGGKLVVTKKPGATRRRTGRRVVHRP